MRRSCGKSVAVSAAGTTEAARAKTTKRHQAPARCSRRLSCSRPSGSPSFYETEGREQESRREQRAGACDVVAYVRLAGDEPAPGVDVGEVVARKFYRVRGERGLRRGVSEQLEPAGQRAGVAQVVDEQRQECERVKSPRLRDARGVAP